MLVSIKMRILAAILAVSFTFLGAYGACPVRPSAVALSPKLAKLRAEMTKLLSVPPKGLEAFIITNDDEHQGEFIAERDKRLQYISGFKGRSGLAAVTKTKAALWVEPEDFWMAENQVDCDWVIFKLGSEFGPHLTEWLKTELQIKTGVRVGADPKLVPAEKWDDWRDELRTNHIALVETSTNLVDDIWTENRPPFVSQPVFFVNGGETRESKLDRLRINLKKVDCDTMIVTALDEIAWLLNVRGREGAYIPFVRSYFVVRPSEAYWYIPREQRTDTIYRELEKHNISRIRTHYYDNIYKDLKNNVRSWGRVLVPSRCEFAPGASQFIASSVPPNQRISKQSPVIFLKAIKNKSEIEGMRAGNLKASAAFTDFLASLEDEMSNNGNWTEISLTKKLDDFMRNQTGYQAAAAPTKVAFGSHGVLRNYEADSATDLMIDDTTTLVIHAKYHFSEGTCSIARTVHFGQPTVNEIRAYTLTLAGLIELSMLSFPAYTRTVELDVVARQPLWDPGAGYNHSTGHGIGAFSTYHEPPFNIHRNARSQMQTLERANFLTLGPSFSKGSFGVSLENVVEVVNKYPTLFDSTVPNLAFVETSLVPFEAQLIDPSLLTPKQVKRINEYHERVLQEVGAELKRQSRMSAFYWLMKKTKSITPVCNSSVKVWNSSVVALVLLFSVRYLL